MKKIKKGKLYKNEAPLSKAEEPEAVYGSKAKNTPSLKEVTYNDFKKVADKIPFTQAEWADILHISERTLQRYAKDNHAFAPINAERLHLMERVLQQARATFGKAENFYDWIKRNPNSVEGSLSMQSLSSYDGIQQVLTQLGRIQHGIFA